MERSLKKLFSSLKGISGSGDVLRVYRDYSGHEHLTLEPGDYVGKHVMAAPIGVDLWYLHNHVNLIVVDEEEQYKGKAYTDGPLSFLEEGLGGVKPLKAIFDVDDIEKHPGFYRPAKNVLIAGIGEYWRSNGTYFVQQIAFEMALKGETYSFPSDEPVEAEGEEGYAGYLTIPVGQLGVMQVISIFGQTDIEGEDFELKDDEKPLFQYPPEVFPPWSEHVGENWCFGRHLIQSGYVVPDDERSVVEIAAPHPSLYGDVRPKGWIRIWLRNRDVFPTPGEFVGILCKPPAVPPHVWWFQESSPFLYAGCWMETRHLTGGVIVEVGENDGPYTVRVQGYEVKINTSDFYEYEVDERVGIVKKDMVGAGSEAAAAPESEQQGYAFYSGDQLKITKENEGQVIHNLTIIPIAFYKENGNE